MLGIVMRLGLDIIGDRLTFYLYLAQQTINGTLTNGADGRTWIIGRE